MDTSHNPTVNFNTIVHERGDGSEGRQRDTLQTSSGLYLAPLPRHWRLQHLLKEIAQDLTNEEFENLKCVFKGKGGFGRGKIENITRLEMLDSLLKSGFISENNVLYLQACLPKRIASKVQIYAHMRMDMLHFDPPLDDPVAGHRSSDIHIKGKDFRTYPTEQLTELAERVKEIALVPLSENPESSVSLKINVAIPTMNDDIARRKGAFVIYIETGVQKDAPNAADIKLLRRQLALNTEEIQKLTDENTDNKQIICALREQNEEINAKYLNQSKVNGSLQNELSEAEKKYTELISEIKDLEEYIDTPTKIKRGANASFKLRDSNRRSVLDLEVELNKAHQTIRRLESELVTNKSQTEEEFRSLASKQELTEESLRNFQNKKEWYEFGRKMQFISGMSLTVKKLYGNFDPSHEPIRPEYDAFFTRNIERVFPQINMKQPKQKQD